MQLHFQVGFGMSLCGMVCFRGSGLREMVSCSDASCKLEVVANGCLCQESISDAFSIVEREGESVAHAALI